MTFLDQQKELLRQMETDPMFALIAKQQGIPNLENDLKATLKQMIKDAEKLK